MVLIPSVKTQVTKDPLVSVVIPARNDEVGIARCLGGIARQNLPLEVIVVDDGSTDGTATVAREAGAIVLNGDGRGAAHARNLGIDEARGTYILFTDADCIPCPGWARALLDPLLEGKAIATKGVYRSQQGEYTACFVQLEYEERYRRMAESPAIDFLDTYCLGVVAGEIRAIGGFDEAFAGASVEDQEMSFRLRTRGRFKFVPEAVVMHRHAATPKSYAQKKFKIGRGKATIARRHRECIQGDSHTPSALRWQLPAVWASLGLALLAPFVAAAGFMALLLGAAPLFLSTQLLAQGAKRHGVLFAVPSMALVLVRGWSLSLGFACGIFRPLATLTSQDELQLRESMPSPVDCNEAPSSVEQPQPALEGVEEGDGVYHPTP